MSADNQKRIRELLLEQLQGRNAHIDFESAVTGIPFEDLGKKPDGFDHSLWELVEHIRIAQRDIIEFSTDPDYSAPDWPDDFWPEGVSPGERDQWEKSVQAVLDDKEEMEELVKDPQNDLLKQFSHGDGQTLFREAMLIVDHNSYHIGQIVTLRKYLGNWQR